SVECVSTDSRAVMNTHARPLSLISTSDTVGPGEPGRSIQSFPASWSPIDADPSTVSTWMASPNTPSATWRPRSVRSEAIAAAAAPEPGTTILGKIQYWPEPPSGAQYWTPTMSPGRKVNASGPASTGRLCSSAPWNRTVFSNVLLSQATMTPCP